MLEAVEVDVGALVPGRVAALRCDEGDDVARGDVVAVLEAEELTAAAAAAAAAARAASERITAARAGYAAAEDRFARVARAYPAGITKAEYESARAVRDGAAAELASARSLAAQAEATRAQLEARRREVEIVAPITGVVLSRNVETGEVVAAGTPVVTLAALSVLDLHVFIPEAKVGLVNVGDPVEVAVDSYRGEIFRGKVKAVGSKAEFTPRNVESREDRVALVFKVTVAVPNGDGRLKAGMPADATFVGAAVPD
jgi:HlyD family secretion protein